MSISSDSRRISEDVTELDESDSDSGDSIPHSEHPSEIEQIFEDLSQNVTLLYRLSMTIRSGKWSNRYIKSASEPTADTSYFEEYDIRYVQDKFPEAPKYLAERLGKANSRRRQYLKYRERHAAKLAYAIDENKDDVAPSETIASVIPRDLITSHKVVDDLQSETSYATSVGVGNSSRMPKMPKQGVDEQPFECPYCHTIEVVKNTHDWRKHVFRDLEAFVCTFPDCTTPNETYGSRRDWFMHEISDHRRVWTCGGHCNREFRSGKELINHMKLIGSIDIADKQISALLEMRSSPISKTAEFCCPLCQAKPVGTSSLRRHLGRHLQDISLFALPMLDNEDDESSTGSDPTEPDLKARDLDEAREESSLKNRDSGLGDNGVDLIALASSSSTDKNDKRSNRTANDEPIAPVTIPDDVVRDLKRLTGAMEPDRKRRMDKEKAAKEDEEFKAKEDEAYRERLRKQLASKGFPDAEIKRILEQPYTEDTKRKMEEEFKAQRSGQPLPFRPSFVKVNKKYLDPETLDKYKLPWEWDDVSSPKSLFHIIKSPNAYVIVYARVSLIF